MGLDTVVLVFEVERTFGISISDKEGEGIRTVGDLYRSILAKITIDDRALCQRTVAFYRFRRAVIDTFGLLRADIRPATALEAIIPRVDRRSCWQRLALVLGQDLPRLRRPPAWERGLITARLGLLPLLPPLFGYLAGAWGVELAVWAVFGILLDEILLEILIHTLTEPYALEFARGCQTVRGVVEALARQERRRMVPAPQSWNKAEVWEALRGIIVEQLGVPPDEVTEHAGWAELGAD
jgi:acyl carrier protein